MSWPAQKFCGHLSGKEHTALLDMDGLGVVDGARGVVAAAVVHVPGLVVGRDGATHQQCGEEGDLHGGEHFGFVWKIISNPVGMATKGCGATKECEER